MEKMKVANESGRPRLRLRRPRFLRSGYLRNAASFLTFGALYAGLNMALFGYRVWQYRDRSLLEQLARGTGFCLNLDCAVVLLLVLRRLLTWLRARRVGQLLPLEQHIYLHKMAGWSVYILSSAHTLFHMANFVNMSEASGVTVRDYLFDTSMGIGWFAGSANITGIALLVILTVMVVCSHRAVRKSGYFEIFYWTHLLSIPTWVLLILHSPNFWKWFLVPGALFAVEVGCRVSRVCSDRGRSIVTSVTILPSEVVCITVARPPDFQFQAGDFCYVNLPGVAKYEWHPFTISSSPENNDEITFHIRAVGEWTRSLHDKVLEACLKSCLYDQFLLMRGTVLPGVPSLPAAPGVAGAPEALAQRQRLPRPSVVQEELESELQMTPASEVQMASVYTTQAAPASAIQTSAALGVQVAPPVTQRRSGASALLPAQMRRLEWLRRDRSNSAGSRCLILSGDDASGADTPGGVSNDGYQSDPSETEGPAPNRRLPGSPTNADSNGTAENWGDGRFSAPQRCQRSRSLCSAPRLRVTVSEPKLASNRLEVSKPSDAKKNRRLSQPVMSEIIPGDVALCDAFNAAAFSYSRLDDSKSSRHLSLRRLSRRECRVRVSATNQRDDPAYSRQGPGGVGVQVVDSGTVYPDERSSDTDHAWGYVSDAVTAPEPGEHKDTPAEAPSEVRPRAKAHTKSAKKHALSIQHAAVDKLSWKVYLDGPYGAPSTSVFHAQHAVLIGGGIGVTPFASVLHCIMDRYTAAHRPCPHCRVPTCLEMPSTMLKLRKVDFVWVNRDMRSFEWFLQLLHELRESQRQRGSPLDSFLTMQLYKTSSMPIVGHVPLRNEVKQGRPDWDKVFAQIRERRKGKITVFYCGPPALGSVVREKAAKYGFGFVKEMF